MSSNLTMIDTNFADDQVGQTNFIAFSDTMNTADTNVNSVDSNIDKSKVCNSDDISATDDAASNADTGNTDENIPSEVHDNETEVKVSVTNDKLTENETPLQGNIDKSNLNAVKSTKEASESSDKPSECTEASSKHETVSTDLLDNVNNVIKSEGPPADVDSSNSIEKITENLPVDLIEKIINTEGLDGTIEKNPVENSITETQKQAEETHASGSVKIEEIKVTETDQLDETNIETVENHVKETTGGENQGVVQDDDEGDGMLYIDEGNANSEGNNNPDDDKPKEETKPDSDDEEKDKDSSDSDTSVEEEEDEDEKVFGENIKEKKRSVIKKAKDESRPAEKIDIEAFKNEWSDEEGDDADVDMKDTSTTKQQKSEALNDGKSKPKDAVINDTTAAVTNATSTVTNDTSAVTNDTPTQQETVHIEPDKTKDTLQQQQQQGC
uniref:Uncharacterized protein n=1 Tax=Cacopsylla melanoneura TaxID=428564 RepID=A0A8D9A1R5_9HEMI